MRPTRLPALHRLSCGLFASSLLLSASWAFAQPAIDAAEFQRRAETCLQSEEWLVQSCMKALRDSVTPNMGGSERQNADAPLNKRMPDDIVLYTTEGNPMSPDERAAYMSEMENQREMDRAAAESLPRPHWDDIIPSPMSMGFDELHVVGIYDVSMERAEDGTVSRGRVHVTVDRPGKEVALLLTSYEFALWDVSATPGTTVTRVTLGGYEAKNSAVMVNGDAFSHDVLDTPVVYEETAHEFHSYIETAQSSYGVKEVASFKGAYNPPVEGFLLDAAPGVATRAEEEARLAASAVPFAALPSAFQEAIKGFEDTVVTFDETGFHGTLPSGNEFTIELPLDLPPVSWPSGVAHDESLERLWAGSIGGEGVLYHYDMRTNKWRATSMNNMDVGALHYDESSDTLMAISNLGSVNFVQFDTSGEVLEMVSLDLSSFDGLTRIYEPGNGPDPLLAVLATEGDQVLVRAKAEDHAPTQTGEVLYYVIDRTTGEADLIK